MSAVLESATVIRVPPPGHDPDYVVAAVRTESGLRVARLLLDDDVVPEPGSRLEPVPGSEPPAYRVVASA